LARCAVERAGARMGAHEDGRPRGRRMICRWAP
jgi:hypothetical protein